MRLSVYLQRPFRQQSEEFNTCRKQSVQILICQVIVFFLDDFDLEIMHLVFVMSEDEMLQFLDDVYLLELISIFFS